MSQRLDVRMSDTLFNWIARKAKQLGFESTAAYVRHVFEELRLQDIGVQRENRNEKAE
jgi:hypothetical protein